MLLVAPVSWRGWLAISGVYFLLFAVVSVIGLIRGEVFTWDQAVRLWLLTNVPGTFLILAFLPRPIRAVGPLVLVFMVAAVAGPTLWHNVLEFAGGPPVFLPVINFFNALGLESRQAVDAATYAVEIVGALGLALLGWLFLRGIGRLYRWHVITALGKRSNMAVQCLWQGVAPCRQHPPDRRTVATDHALPAGDWVAQLSDHCLGANSGRIAILLKASARCP
jgi:hypothetical protein